MVGRVEASRVSPLVRYSAGNACSQAAVRWSDTQTNRQTDRQRHRQTDIETDRQKGRQAGGHEQADRWNAQKFSNSKFRLW
jgi:hypothetical protein